MHRCEVIGSPVFPLKAGAETVLLDVLKIDFTHHEVWRRMASYSVHFVCSFPRHEMGGAYHVVFVGWICDRIKRGLNQNLTHGDVVLKSD